MNNGSENGSEDLNVPKDEEFTPRAVRLSGSSVTGIVYSVIVDGEDYYTLAAAPLFEPAGWSEDQGVIDAVVAKHRFVILDDPKTPRLKQGALIESIRKLSKWLEKKRP